VLVTGRTAVARLAQALEMEFSEREGVGTVGGLVSALFGRIPRVGEKLEHRGYTIEVLDAERKRVNRVRFRKNPE
jgi:CBS domain containing-hemolysin-like protein